MTFLDETLDFFNQYGLKESDIAYCQIFDEDGKEINITFDNFKNITKRIVGEYGDFDVDPSIRIVFKNRNFAFRDSYIIDVTGYKKMIRHWNYVNVPTLDVPITTISASEAIRGLYASH